MYIILLYHLRNLPPELIHHLSDPRKFCTVVYSTGEFLPKRPFIQNLSIPIIHATEIEKLFQRIIRF